MDINIGGVLLLIVGALAVIVGVQGSQGKVWSALTGSGTSGAPAAPPAAAPPAATVTPTQVQPNPATGAFIPPAITPAAG